MRPHLHLLGILQLVWGAIGLLLGASMLLLAVGAIAIGVTSADDRMAAGVTAGAFVLFGVALLVGLISGLLPGIMAMRMRVINALRRV